MTTDSIAVRVDGLSKRYRIGQREAQQDTLAGTVGAWLRSPARNFQSLRRLSHFEEGREDPDILWALQDVSFEVKPGEVLGIVGANGAGKSTLLKILSRITPPTRGEAIIEGRVASLLEVGTGFHPELTGRENVYLNGALLGLSKADIDRVFDDVVAFAEIERFIDTPVKRYSSGMYVRLAFAVGAHLHPDVLIVDEVLAVGDAQFQRKCFGAMDDVAKQGRTILFVSHNMAAVERLCSRAILIAGGRVEAEGPVAEVLPRYVMAGKHAQHAWRREEPPPAHPYIQRLQLCDAAGAPLSVATTQSAIGVQIECVLPEADDDAKLAVAVYDVYGQALFATTPLDAEVPHPATPGTHHYTVMFPEACFMPQTYTLSVAIYDSPRYSDRAVHALVLEVHERASLANLGDVLRPGMLQVPCRWERRGER